MPDDILDAAQKAINDAANAGVPSGAPSEPVPATPAAPPPEPEPMPMTPPPSAPEPLSEQPKEKAPEPVPVPTPTPEVPAPEPVVPAAKTETGSPQSVPDVVPGLAPDSTIVPPVKPAKPASVDKPKRKFPGAIIAVVITLLLALPVAVYYISQQNQQLADVRSRATGSTYSCQHTSDCPSGSFCNLNSHSCQATAGGTYACNFASPTACGGHPDWCHCTGGNACTGSECVDATWIQNVCTSQGRSYCTNVYGSGKTCCAAGYTCCTTMNGCCQGGGPTNPPHTPPPGSTSTPTSTVNPVCQNIKIYKGGTQVTDLNTLKAGDTVSLAVKGNLSPSKAHFRVNGKKPSDANTAGWDETTTKNGSDEWTLNYTIPEGVTDFVIEGEVYTNGAWH